MEGGERSATEGSFSSFLDSYFLRVPEGYIFL